MTENLDANPLAKRVFFIAAIVVAIEALVLIAATGWLVFEIVAGQSRSIEAAGMLAGLVALTAAWISMSAVRLREGLRWARSSAVFWQTCQLAIAWASFSGPGANAAIGISLIVPSVLVLALLFSKPVLNFASTQA